MSKSQIIVIAIALLLVVGMFFLPKVIINKEKDGLSQPVASATRDQAADEEDHSGHDHAPGEHPGEETAAAMPHAAATPAQLKELAQLRKQYDSEAAADAKAQLASQLAQKYRAVSKFDSAGYYYEVVAITRPSEKNFQKAGDQYFEAFTFATNEAKAKALSDKIQAMYTRVLEANPNNMDAKTNLAMTYINGPNPMQGITLLREVIEKDPNNEKAIYNLGYLSLQSRQYDKAAERFRKLVELDPDHVNGNFYLGVSLAETGNKKEAIAAFNRVKTLEKDPELHATVDEYLRKLQ
ncbi:MAG TPA: tetratricopeptide repeat protein [Adhaeribacter sp.]|nr:tetratricopeptide repeat protein [Adhaeribacter sp.]